MNVCIRLGFFVSGRPYQLSIMFEGKTCSLPESGAPFKVIHEGRVQPYSQTSDKAGWACQNSSLLRTFVNYDPNKFHNIWPTRVSTTVRYGTLDSMFARKY
jgi:hypothetical protein